MIIRRRKSRPAQVADAVGKTAKDVTKTAKGTGVYKFLARSPLGKAIPIAAGAGVAAIVAVKALRGGGRSEPASA
jgi:hypothetical protein